MKAMKGKRTLAGITAVTMAVSLVPVWENPLVIKASAEGYVKSETNTTLGTTGIGAPSSESSNATWTGNYVYYGKYGGSPVKYRVLDPKTQAFNSASETTAGRFTMLLDCDTTLKNMAFHGSSNVWNGSSVQTWLKGNEFYGGTNVFTDAEKAAIAESRTSIQDGVTSYLKHTNLDSEEGENVFLLDVTEANNAAYGYSNNNTRKKTRVS